jgi:hypothetical protein
VDSISWWDAIHNWIFAFLGNFVGAAVFVASAYWYLYARDEDAGEPSGGGVRATQASDGRSGRDRELSPTGGEPA